MSAPEAIWEGRAGTEVDMTDGLSGGPSRSNSSTCRTRAEALLRTDDGHEFAGSTWPSARSRAAGAPKSPATSRSAGHSQTSLRSCWRLSPRTSMPRCAACPPTRAPHLGNRGSDGSGQGCRQSSRTPSPAVRSVRSTAEDCRSRPAGFAAAGHVQAGVRALTRSARAQDRGTGDPVQCPTGRFRRSRASVGDGRIRREQRHRRARGNESAGDTRPGSAAPGRFGRQVTVPPPNQSERAAILAVHVGGKHLGPDVELGVVAQGTPGFSGGRRPQVGQRAGHQRRPRRPDGTHRGRPLGRAGPGPAPPARHLERPAARRTPLGGRARTCRSAVRTRRPSCEGDDLPAGMALGATE